MISLNFVEVGCIIIVMCNVIVIDFFIGDIDWFIDGYKVRENLWIIIIKYLLFVEKVIISKFIIMYV